MASALPVVSDCCSACSGTDVTITTASVLQVYTGSGNPNGVTSPDDGTIANVYYNVDVPGEIWYWSIAGQAWF